MATIKSFIRSLRGGIHLPSDPVRDWIVMVSFAALMLIGLLVWNAWVFDTVASGGTLGKSASTTPSAYSNASLDSIRAAFGERLTEEKKYITGVYRYADPSQ